MPEIKKYSIQQELKEADEKLMDDPSLLGMTMLTYPTQINAMRATMFTSHLKQFLNLKNAEIPLVFTGTENMVGKYSSGYKRTKHKLEVYKKISKFDDLLDNPFYYYLFVYDKTLNRYDVIFRKPYESLTENFGYQYLDDVIDSFKEGDTINENTVLYHSTSYDEDMNYGYGANITVAYCLDAFTSEDGAVISESVAKKLTSVEVDEINIGLNSNDFFINKYGDDEDYKPLPDLGEVVSDVLCGTRRQYNNQLLFDFKDSNLKEIHEESGDQPYFIQKNEMIVDYVIYNNQEEIVDTPFNKQVNKYLRSQNRFYRKIIKTCEAIINSGEDYSNDIDYLYKRASEFLDSQTKWQDSEGRRYSSMEIKVQTVRNAPMSKGSKFAGRFGNKSVVSEIRPDEDMPYTKDGRRVGILLSLLSIVNRTTAMVLFETFINGASYQTRLAMNAMKTLEEKENILFDYIHTLNEKQEAKWHSLYRKYSKKNKEKYIEGAINDGILVHIPPIGDKTPLFYRCQNLIEKFDYLKPDILYIKKYGREMKCLSKCWIGEQYIIKLKQTGRRGFSARSTGAVDLVSLPTRSFKSKNHLEQKSTSCIRFGEFETFGFSIGVLSEDIALFHALYRTSILGRKNFIDYMFSDDNDPNAILKIKDVYTSRVAEVFSVILKSLGMAIRFVDEKTKPHIVSDSNISAHRINEKVYICSDYQFYIIQNIYDIRERILQKYPIITKPVCEGSSFGMTKVNTPDELESAYEEAVNSEIFVDKSEMISFLNTVVRTKQKYAM